MDMEILIKGKRTKRQRPLSPSPNSALPTNTIITSSSSSASEDAYATHLISAADSGSLSSATTTYESTEEEEDMANCLILLAQGDAGAPHQADNNIKTQQKGSSRIKFGEMASVSATASSKLGFDIYECKTCNRTFSSFQALGGHRASHKKPKVSSPSASTDVKKPSSPPALAILQPQPDYDFEEAVAHIKTGLPHQISLQLPTNRSGFITSLNNKAAKLHECSICGSEFTSGQALGGHMRRHRASTRTSSDQAAAPMGPTEEPTCHASTAVNLNVRVKPRNILPLDLNLPAPEDDLRESKFQFVPTQKAMVLSAPALVDCHY